MKEKDIYCMEDCNGTYYCDGIEAELAEKIEPSTKAVAIGNADALRYHFNLTDDIKLTAQYVKACENAKSLKIYFWEGESYESIFVSANEEGITVVGVPENKTYDYADIKKIEIVNGPSKEERINKSDFIDIVKDILEECPVDDLDQRGEQMKKVIDKMIKQEKHFAKAGIR